jgi:two-component system, NarL family, nitrate/nitrite response regulator NarL
VPRRRDAQVYTVAVLAADPLARAELSAFLDGLGLSVFADLEPGDPDGLLSELAAELDAVLWEVDGDEPLESVPAGVPLLALAQGPEDAAHALRQGAVGVVARSLAGERLLTVLGAMAQGLAVLEPAFLPAPQTADDLEPLTPRERDVLGLLAEGLSNKAIAKRLGVSDHTVKFHLNAVLGKLGARNRTEAVTNALRAGLLTL